MTPAPRVLREKYCSSRHLELDFPPDSRGKASNISKYFPPTLSLTAKVNSSLRAAAPLHQEGRLSRCRSCLRYLRYLRRGTVAFQGRRAATVAAALFVDSTHSSIYYLLSTIYTPRTEASVDWGSIVNTMTNPPTLPWSYLTIYTIYYLHSGRRYQLATWAE